MFEHFAFLDIGTPELIIILIILLLLFGSSRLPQLSRSIGESMHELRKGMNGDINDKNTEEKPTKKDTPSA